MLQKTSKRILDSLPRHRIVIDPTQHTMAHPTYETIDIQDIKVTHRAPDIFRDRLAYYSVKFIRNAFDLVTGYREKGMASKDWINRCVFLETVAGVPGMVGGMTLHLKSLVNMKEDSGLINHLLEEAENERTHLFIFLNYKQPGLFFRVSVALSQAAFWNLYFVAYLFSPKFCHRFVGYLEEEAVHTYSMFLKQLDDGILQDLAEQEIPLRARDYYQLPEQAKFRDLILAIRADESIHREMNHYFCDLGPNERAENHPEVLILDKAPISSEIRL